MEDVIDSDVPIDRKHQHYHKFILLLFLKYITSLIVIFFINYIIKHA